MTFLKTAPLAFVMIAGPQIVSAVMFATSRKGPRDSVAYVSGAIISTIVGTTICFLVAEAIGLRGSTSGGHVVVDWIFVALLAVLGLRVYLRWAESEPPSWMSKLQTVSPRFAFTLGLVLFISMPTDVLTMLTVGGYLSAHDESLASAIPFFLLTALLIVSRYWCC